MPVWGCWVRALRIKFSYHIYSCTAPAHLWVEVMVSLSSVCFRLSHRLSPVCLEGLLPLDSICMRLRMNSPRSGASMAVCGHPCWTWFSAVIMPGYTGRSPADVRSFPKDTAGRHGSCGHPLFPAGRQCEGEAELSSWGRMLRLKFGTATHKLLWPWEATYPLCVSMSSFLNEVNGSNYTMCCYCDGLKNWVCNGTT